MMDNELVGVPAWLSIGSGLFLERIRQGTPHARRVGVLSSNQEIIKL